MYCVKCGCKVNENAAYCPKCGAKLSAWEEAGGELTGNKTKGRGWLLFMICSNLVFAFTSVIPIYVDTNVSVYNFWDVLKYRFYISGIREYAYADIFKAITFSYHDKEYQSFLYMYFFFLMVALLNIVLCAVCTILFFIYLSAGERGKILAKLSAIITGSSCLYVVVMTSIQGLASHIGLYNFTIFGWILVAIGILNLVFIQPEYKKAIK